MQTDMSLTRRKIAEEKYDGYYAVATNLTPDKVKVKMISFTA